MFDWVLNTHLNTVTIFFMDVFFDHFKVNDFELFLTLKIYYQYLQEAKAYLEPSRTYTMELFCEKCFLQNSQEYTFAKVSF